MVHTAQVFVAVRGVAQRACREVRRARVPAGRSDRRQLDAGGRQSVRRRGDAQPARSVVRRIRERAQHRHGRHRGRSGRFGASSMNALIAGIDEAGRGPLAGPVVAAAVILDGDRRVAGLRDSKLLTAEARERLAAAIRTHAIAWAVGVAEVMEIDALNILNASLLAMRRAVEALSVAPTEALVDGDRCPALDCPVRAIVKGDRDVPAISAASILAKTVRDAMLVELDRLYPVYGFARNKGYATADHLAALDRHGPCAAHRRFMPVVQPSLDFGDWILEEKESKSG